MPKFKVYVQRLVPQWRTVVVDAESEAEVDAKADEIFNAACNLDHWEYDDDCPSSTEPSKVMVVDTTDEEPDVRL